MNLGSLFSQRISLLPYLLVALIITFTLHEFAHALVAKWLGDDYPEREGRLSLNPMEQIDLKGLLLMILVGIGWSKPTPLYEENYKSSSDYILSVVAGPIMNLILAILGAFCLTLFIMFMPNIMNLLMGSISPEILNNSFSITYQFLVIFIQINVFFLIFNLLPLPGLDGFMLWGHLLGNPPWFYSFFSNPLVTILIFVGIISKIIPVELWSNLLRKGLLELSFQAISVFL